MLDVELLLSILPKGWSKVIEDHDEITEVVIDAGRPLEVRYADGIKVFFDDVLVNQKQVKAIHAKCGVFGSDNRAGIDKTLHRISQILHRNGQVTGLTCRIGRAFPGCIEVVSDLVGTGESILIVGPPGVGKTTKLRDICRFLSTDLNRSVVIIDTSNEIAGDGIVPHPAVGRSRRLQVPIGTEQYHLMIEAVENHAPQVVVIDEIGNRDEAASCVTIAQRGVQLVATAHGRCLNDVLTNPALMDLLGGVREATVSDDTMRRKGLTSKTVLGRSSKPCFTIVIEILGHNHFAIHRDIAATVDCLLAGGTMQPETRELVKGQWVVREGFLGEPEMPSESYEVPGSRPPKSQRRDKPRQAPRSEQRYPQKGQGKPGRNAYQRRHR